MIQIPDSAPDFSFIEATSLNTSGYLYIADSNYDLKFGGVTYSRFPLKFTPPSISSDNSIDTASIVVANVSREIMYYVERFNGLKNMRVKVKTVYAKFLDEVYSISADGTTTAVSNLPAAGGTADSQAYIEDEFFVDSYTSNEQAVSFNLLPIVDFEIKLPRRRYMQDSCYAVYKEATTCKYAAGNPTWATYGSVVCPKNLDACKKRQNEENFMGFPGISASRRIFL